MIKRGSRVRYIKVDTKDDKATGYYPPVGTLGTVKYVDGFGCQVKWDEGTNDDGIWWCELVDVEEASACTNLKDLLSQIDNKTAEEIKWIIGEAIHFAYMSGVIDRANNIHSNHQEVENKVFKNLNDDAERELLATIMMKWRN